MTEQEPKQKKLIDQSETGEWISQPDNLEKSKKIADREIAKPKKGGYDSYTEEELAELDERPHQDRGYN